MSKLLGVNVQDCVEANNLLIRKGYDDLVSVIMKLNELYMNTAEKQLNINHQISNNIWRTNVDYTWKKQI